MRHLVSLFVLCSFFSLFLIILAFNASSPDGADNQYMKVRCKLISSNHSGGIFDFFSSLLQLFRGHLFLFLFLQFFSTALFYFSCFLFLQDMPSGSFALLWSACSITLSATDFLYYLLPNMCLFFFACLVFLFRFSIYPSTLLFLIGGSLILFMLFYFLLLMYPKGLGGGDVKLAALIGFAFGYRKSILSLLVSCLCALLYGLFLLFFTKKESQ